MNHLNQTSISIEVSDSLRGFEGFQASVSKHTRGCGTPNTDKQPPHLGLRAIQIASEILRVLREQVISSNIKLNQATANNLKQHQVTPTNKSADVSSMRTHQLFRLQTRRQPLDPSLVPGWQPNRGLRA